MNDFFKGASIIIMYCYNYMPLYGNSISFYTCNLLGALVINKKILENKKMTYEDEYCKLAIRNTNKYLERK